MVYNEQFIAYGNRSAFNADLAKGKIKKTSIVFIEDTKLIWTLGTIYSCPFTAEEIQRFLDTKVDKVEGKDLSTNDYTDTDKAKLTALPTAAELNTELEDNIDDAVLKSLIAEATAAGAVYNNKTGYFELNGLVDITEAQMRIILRNTQRPPFNVFSSTSQRASLRTNLWEASPQSTHDVTIQSKGVFSGWLAAEVINLDNGATDVFATKINGYDTFKACTELHTILGDFSFGNGATTDTTFASCFKLRSFRLYGVNYDIDLHWSPLIAVESLQYLVTNAANTSSITVTVHPDVYAKLTGDTTNAAAAALTASELAQWQQVATNAAAKNIAFATSN